MKAGHSLYRFPKSAGLRANYPSSGHFLRTMRFSSPSAGNYRTLRERVGVGAAQTTLKSFGSRFPALNTQLMV